jgi:hypothetical protein
MYDPCYTSNLGLVGFRCRVGDCKKVVRSYRGIVMHCKRVHGLEAQMKLPLPPTLPMKMVTREELLETFPMSEEDKA